MRAYWEIPTVTFADFFRRPKRVPIDEAEQKRAKVTVGVSHKMCGLMKNVIFVGE